MNEKELGKVWKVEKIKNELQEITKFIMEWETPTKMKRMAKNI